MKEHCLILIIFLVLLMHVNGKLIAKRRLFYTNHKEIEQSDEGYVKLAKYLYNPPTVITYKCHKCNAPKEYPVYHGTLPNYVYKLRESSSKYGFLLTGLALYNLGRVSTRRSQQMYLQYPGEECSVHLYGKNRYEEAAIPCFMLSTFIQRDPDPKSNESKIYVDILRSRVDVKSYIETKGVPIKLNNFDDCIVWHNASMVQRRHLLPCPLLRYYAETVQPAGVPLYVWPVTIAAIVAVYVLFYSLRRKKRSRGEQFNPVRPSNSVQFTNYYANSK